MHALQDVPRSANIETFRQVPCAASTKQSEITLIALIAFKTLAIGLLIYAATTSFLKIPRDCYRLITTNDYLVFSLLKFTFNFFSNIVLTKSCMEQGLKFCQENNETLLTYHKVTKKYLIADPKLIYTDSSKLDISLFSQRQHLIICLKQIVIAVLLSKISKDCFSELTYTSHLINKINFSFNNTLNYADFAKNLLIIYSGAHEFKLAYYTSCNHLREIHKIFTKNNIRELTPLAKELNKFQFNENEFSNKIVGGYPINIRYDKLVYNLSKKSYERFITHLIETKHPHLIQLLSSLKKDVFIKNLVTDKVLEVIFQHALHNFSEKDPSPFIKKISTRVSSFPIDKYSSPLFKQHQELVVQERIEKQNEEKQVLDTLREAKILAHPKKEPTSFVSEAICPTSHSLKRMAKENASEYDKFIQKKREEEEKLLKKDQIFHATLEAPKKQRFENWLEELIKEELELNKQSKHGNEPSQSSAKDIQIVHVSKPNDALTGKILPNKPCLLGYAKVHLTTQDKNYIMDALKLLEEISVLDHELSRIEVDETFYVDGMLDCCFRLTSILGIFVEPTKNKFLAWRNFFRHHHQLDKNSVKEFLLQIKNLEHFLIGLKKGVVFEFEIKTPIEHEERSIYFLKETLTKYFNFLPTRIDLEQHNQSNRKFIEIINQVNRGWFFRVGSMMRDLKNLGFINRLKQDSQESIIFNDVINLCNRYAHESIDGTNIIINEKIAFEMTGSNLLPLYNISQFMNFEYKLIEQIFNLSKY